ncbi:MAG: hypothetical protein MPJ78_13310 [Hyphomicrobiaceae bacterium]|nr:hypothetical protein [Hyphomicrobiaceae bacterium]
MSKSPAKLRVVSSNDHLTARDKLANAFKNSMTEHLRAHTKGTNVNPETLLTTDYLNHFNEIIMLLELVPSAPVQFASELAEWQHESYEEHFTHSGFRDKELAIVCYHNAPEDIRHAFDSSIADLEQEMILLLQQVQDKINTGDTEGLTRLCDEGVPRLQDLVQISAGIVNGALPNMPEAANQNDAPAGASATQSDVDALFD